MSDVGHFEGDPLKMTVTLNIQQIHGLIVYLNDHINTVCDKYMI